MPTGRPTGATALRRVDREPVSLRVKPVPSGQRVVDTVCHAACGLFQQAILHQPGDKPARVKRTRERRELFRSTVPPATTVKEEHRRPGHLCGCPRGRVDVDHQFYAIAIGVGFNERVADMSRCTSSGFDEEGDARKAVFIGLPYSNDMGRQGQEWNPPPLPLVDGETVLEAQPDQASLTQRYTEHAVRFIRRHRDEPFLLYLTHMHVHLPLYVADRFLQDSTNGLYGASVACIDWSTGVILHTLRQFGLDQNTIVMFTSDNGSRCDFGPSNGHLHGKKGLTWEGGARVPLLARWPGLIPAGVVRHELTTGMDLLPRITELGTW